MKWVFKSFLIVTATVLSFSCSNDFVNEHSDITDVGESSIFISQHGKPMITILCVKGREKPNSGLSVNPTG